MPDEDSYVCEKCRADVAICSDCHTIISGCECGHCEEGKVFYEAE